MRRRGGGKGSIELDMRVGELERGSESCAADG